MPEINPLTKDQLFEKKIAENTGSNYNVGDISDVVPVTKDQSLLKEIALNSAGLSEDITELEGKVTANAEAIEAMVNEYGAKNLLKHNAGSGDTYGADYVTNSDGSITITDKATGSFGIINLVTNYPLKAGSYILSGCPTQTGEHYNITLTSAFGNVIDKGNGAEFTLVSDSTVSITIYLEENYEMNHTFYPMIRDARIADNTYVPYAMTNRELTTDVKWLKDKTFVAIPQGGSFSYLVDEKGYFVAINRQDDAGAIYYTSGSTVIRIAGSDVVDQMISISNRVVTITNNVSGTIHASIF